MKALDDYLRYGYLEVNEYLRDPKAFRKSHAPKESRAVARRASGVVAELKAAKTTKPVAACRVQVLSSRDALSALSGNKLTTKSPLFVSRRAAVCKNVEALSELLPGQVLVKMRLRAPLIDVSKRAQKRAGEALLAPQSLPITSSKVDRKGVLNLVLGSRKK